MKAAVFMEPGKMEVHEVEKPTDAILKIVRACVWV
jgi:alcohol dehydrogenase